MPSRNSQFLPGRIRAGLLEEGAFELGLEAQIGVYQMVRKERVSQQGEWHTRSIFAGHFQSFVILRQFLFYSVSSLKACAVSYRPGGFGFTKSDGLRTHACALGRKHLEALLK